MPYETIQNRAPLIWSVADVSYFDGNVIGLLADPCFVGRISES